MHTTTELDRAAPRLDRRGRPRRRIHWWRWIGVGVVVLVVAVVVAVRGFILTPSPAALTLPTSAALAPVGPLDGTWVVMDESLAGFRVQESAFGASNDVVGSTGAVTGTLVVAGDSVTSATFAIDLATVTIDAKPAPQLVAILGTATTPEATFTLATPFALGASFSAGTPLESQVTGELTLNGATRPVTFTVAERRDGARLQVAGSTPIDFSDWGITEPQGYGLLGKLADHGVAEILLVLERS